MKILLFSIAAAITISVTIGIIIISGKIDISSMLQLQDRSAVTQLHGLPTSPAIAVSINGSSTQSPIPRYDVKPGQNITLSIHVTSDPKDIPVRLYANPKLGFPKASGINWYLYYYMLGSPNDSFLNITIAKNVRPGEYPMEIDANTQAIPNVNFTEVTYFDLKVETQNTANSTAAIELRSCNPDTISNQMHEKSYSVNEQKAISLAEEQPEVISKTIFFGYHYDSIFDTWSWNNNCNLTLTSVNVAFQPNNHGMGPLVVTEDPTLEKIIKIEVQPAIYMGGPRY